MQIDHVTVDSLGSFKHELSRTDQPPPTHAPWAHPNQYRALALSLPSSRLLDLT